MTGKTAKDFPLWKHPNGQWAKKVRGKVYYFGTDRDQALQNWLEDREYLIAGLTPPGNGNILQLRDILNGFHRLKVQANEEDEITDRTLREYEAVMDTIAATLGAETDVKLLTADALERLRMSLVTGKKGNLIAPTSQKRLLQMARTIFLYGNEELDAGIKYKKPLRSPSAKQVRRAKNAVGERLFEATEIHKLLDAASDSLRAMILLGINCGFGNHDCATLPIEQVDLADGWHTYWRPKTETPRRCPLWEETSAALSDVIGERTSGLVFLTSFGNPWHSQGPDCPITAEFRKLCIAVGIYRKNVTTFYTLRRSHFTIGATAGEPAASSFIMGHTPAGDDMSAVYRQRHFDESLRKVTESVRVWLS